MRLIPLTLTNDFHQTRTVVRVTPTGYLSRRHAQSARWDLCGAHDCTCAWDVLGTRGMTGWLVEPYPDGSARILPPYALVAPARLCEACDGSGSIGYGLACTPCEGTGVLDEDD